MISRYQKKNNKCSPSYLVALFLCVFSHSLIGGEVVNQVPTDSMVNSSYVLNIRHERISLEATEASVKAIVEQIGRELEFQVDAYVTEDENVTTHFDSLDIEQAIKKLSDNYALFHEEGSGKITRIAIYPIGEDPSKFLSKHITPDVNSGKEASESSQPTQPGPFKFEFDPNATTEVK